MSIIYLLRHAEYDNPRHILPGRLPVELSEKGKKQAEKLRDYFANRKIEKIYSSPVLRCKQTAEIISNGKIPIEFDKRLTEVLSSYQGYWIEDWSYYCGSREIYGGETNIDVQKRMVDFLEKTPFENGKEYIVCSHADPIYFLIQYLRKEKILPEIKIGEDIHVPPDYPTFGSISAIEKENGIWMIRGILKEY
jgi:broad specificity phosphatase PhoE